VRPMEHPGKYLYCVVRCSEERTFEDVAPIGEAGGPIQTVVNDDLAAVVSDSPVVEYESTRTNMMAHERVQEKVMREFTLLPVRFGTVSNPASSTQGIRKLLENRSDEFHRLLADMEEKVEVGLKAFWRDEKAIFDEVVTENRGIQKLRNALDGKPLQAIHFDGIRLGEMVKEALDRKRAAEAASILVPLRRIAYRTMETPVLVDRMILNAAFLVDKSCEEDFDQAVAKLDEEFGHRTVFKYIGPVPPYNFVNITVNWDET